MFNLKVLAVIAGTCPLSFATPLSPDRQRHLFPISPVISSWTTSKAFGNARPLSDDILRPLNMITALPHNYVTAPDGTYSMQAHYPAGSSNFQSSPQGGFSFYAPGPVDVDLTMAKEVTFAFSVLFPSGFNFVKGGKLPGLYGGDTPGGSVSCSGGNKGDSCFSIRHMWRTDGAGEIYAYVPPYTDAGFEANEVLCSVPPYSYCNPKYGNSVGRGAFAFIPGTRTVIAQRVRLNDAGMANGEIELWADGDRVLNLTGLIIRDTDEGRIRGIQMQTFFGGSGSSWATPVDTDAYFSDFSVAITEPLYPRFVDSSYS